jgi:hypothetical protein
MYYRLTNSQENDFLKLPETGMGYQIIDASKAGSYLSERYIVLNSEIVIEMNGSEDGYIRKVINDGILSVKASANLIALSSVSVINERQLRNYLNEPKNDNEKGALDNPVESGNGNETVVRLSAFDDDKRIDKINKCLRPGSYTTTFEDYFLCIYNDDDPVERYSLPNNDEIKFAFFIQPLTSDTLQRGRVQPANGKRGGGKEVYFANGTAKGTFKNQKPYN